MHRRTALLACAAAIIASGGCRILPKVGEPAPVPFNSFAADTLSDVHCVGIVPFSSEAASETTAGEIAVVFATELQRLPRFRVVTARDKFGNPETPPGVDPETPSAIDSLIAARRTSGLDALLVGDITHYRAYGSPVLGVDAKMISCETGEVQWQVSAVFDSSHPEVLARMKNYRVRLEAEGAVGENRRALLDSPRNYARFVAHEIVMTLSDKPVQQHAGTVAYEAPMVRFFSFVRSLPGT